MKLGPKLGSPGKLKLQSTIKSPEKEVPTLNLLNSNKTTIVKDDHSSTSKRVTLNKLLSTQKHSQKSKRGESQESICG